MYSVSEDVLFRREFVRYFAFWLVCRFLILRNKRGDCVNYSNSKKDYFANEIRAADNLLKITLA